MKIAIFGLGYVGATNAACLTKLGHSVVGVDINASKVAVLAAGKSPIVEPMVPELIATGHASGLVHATTSTEEALRDADLAMVCVGTPSQPDGTTEPCYLLRVTEQIATARRRLGRTVPIFVRSTSLPSVHRTLTDVLVKAFGPSQPLAYCVHPEFLREGQAVDDFFNPPKIVYGVTDDAARKVIPDIYPGIEAPTEIMTVDAAALVKYADNCFHALKVTFANEIGQLALSFGVDARDVMRVFCLDTKLNISTRYLRPGLPFGGSCLPKDVKAVNAWSRGTRIKLPVLDELMQSNHRQTETIVERLIALGGESVAFFGLAFKDDTDDLRESPMLAMVEMLHGRGIACRVFDPLVNRDALEALQVQRPMLANVASWMADDGQALISSADIVVIARKKLGIDFALVDWPSRVKVFDLVGLNLPLPPDRVIGLYW